MGARKNAFLQSIVTYFHTLNVLFQFLSFIVFDPFVDLFITLCILVNTLFMALDQHDMDPSLNDALRNGNYVSFFFLLSIPLAKLS